MAILDLRLNETSNTRRFIPLNHHRQVINAGAILDSSACASIVENKSPYKSLIFFKTHRIPDTSPAREHHRFKDHPDFHRTSCAVKLPFRYFDENGYFISQLNIQIHMLEGNLSFPIGLPSLLSMKRCLSFKFKNL